MYGGAFELLLNAAILSKASQKSAWVNHINFNETVKYSFLVNKAGYTATDVACGWAGAIFEVTRPFGQEQ